MARSAHSTNFRTVGTSMASIIARMASPSNLRLVFGLALMAVASAGCSKEEPTREQLLSQANEAFAAGQYGKAEKDYREVLRLASTDPVALRQLGIIYFDQGQIPQAYPLLKKSAELEPDNVEVQLRLGQTLLSFQEYAQAREAAMRVLEKQPGHEQALILLADAAVAPKDIEETQKLIASLREQDQDRPGYHLAMGVLDLRQKDQARAESEFKAAINLDPKSSWAHAALATLYWSRNDLQAAERAFQTAADLAPLRSPIRLRYADFKLRTRAVAEAKNILESIARNTPDYLPPRVSLMKIACAEHRDEDCTVRVQSILAQDPINYEALFLDGVLNLAKGDAPKAIREFEYLSNTYKQNAQVRHQLALAYLLYAKTASDMNSRNAVESAESNLNEAIRLAPNFEQAVLLSAELKIRKGNPAAAVASLVQLTKEKPQLAQAHYLLASAYLAQRRTDQALAVYREMAELFPQDRQPPFLIGSILLGQGKQPEARKAFEKSVEISPDYLPAIEKLVDLDIVEKQFTAAMERVQKQIDKDTTAQALAIRSKIYLAQGDFTHAEADLLKAIDLDPKLDSGYTLLAQLYANSKDAEEAITKLVALTEKKKNVSSLMLLGMINDRLKRFHASRDAYEMLLTVDGNFVPALNNLAVLYSEQLGRPDAAYDLAKKAREIAPDEPHVADTLGWILFKKGDYGNALRLLQESVGKLADHPEVQYHVGMAHYMLGEEEPAHFALRKAADASADFSGKDEARQRLSLLAIKVGTGGADVRTEVNDYLLKWPNDPAALTRVAE